MIDYKYAFACNEMDNNLYAIVMTCWYMNENNDRVGVKSETQINKTLTECFDLAKAFIIPE